MILYKIVNPDRKSIVASAFDLYSLEYKKGTIVKAKKGTLGVFCFKTKLEAETYIQKDFNPSLDNSHMVLRVIPLTEGNEPSVVADALAQNYVTEFYEEGKWKTEPPVGAVCYSSVFVVD